MPSVDYLGVAAHPYLKRALVAIPFYLPAVVPFDLVMVFDHTFAEYQNVCYLVSHIVLRLQLASLQSLRGGHGSRRLVDVRGSGAVDKARNLEPWS